MANESDYGLTSFSSRALLIPGYSAPLFVHVLDAEKKADDTFETALQNIFLIPKRRIITSEKWKSVAEIAIDVLKDEQFWQRAKREGFEFPDAWQKSVDEMVEFYRVETIRQFERTREDKTFFAFEAIRNSLYQASEGSGAEYIEYGAPVSFPLPRVTALFNEELIDRIEARSEVSLGRDDLRIWRQVNNLIHGTVSQEFKKNFAPILNYEIPYGLSPKLESSTLEALIKNARLVAVLPIASGLQSVATALATERWLIAIQGAATTGAVTIIILGSIGISDVILRWLKNRELKEAK